MATTPEVIETLIDKTDNFELIRDCIASILVAEVNNQMTLATAAGRDAQDWNFAVYTERSDPIEIFRSRNGNTEDLTPIVNVLIDMSEFPKTKSNTVNQNTSSSIFYIDVVAPAVDVDVAGGGYLPADEQASRNAQRIVRLVRNILMSAHNIYLQQRGLVWQRYIDKIEFLRPDAQKMVTPVVSGARITFNVMFNEFSPQHTAATIDKIHVGVTRAADGQVLINQEFC